METDRRGLLHRYFSGLAEQTFESRLGVVDPPLIDYVAELLVRFVRCDALYRVRNLSGRPLIEVVGMLMEAEQRIGEAQREVYRHVGDFALFWTGVYPERLNRLSRGGSVDEIVNYSEQGKRSYRLASQLEQVGAQDTSSDLLERLSVQFELCAFGLQQVRLQWESREDEPPGNPRLLLN